MAKPKRSPTVLVLGIALVTFFSWDVPLAHGQQPSMPEIKPQAKVHLERGRRLYLEGRFEESILEFQAGFGVEPHPAFLYALGQAERRKGDCRKALEYYRAFLRAEPPEQQAQAARVQLERCEQVTRVPPSSTAPPRVVPPPVVAPPVPPASPSDVRSPWYEDVLGDVLAGSGVVALGIGTWLFVQAGSDEDNAAHNAPDYRAYSSQLEDAQTKRTAGIVTLLAGGALVGAGILRYVWRPTRPDMSRSSLWVAPRLAGVAVGGAF